MKKVFFLVIFSCGFIFSQNKDSINLDEITVNFNPNFSSEKIKFNKLIDQNLGQDITYLLKQTVSATVTSDSGNGIGYSSLKIRGTDPTRINFTFNDVPLNDSESQNVFWVNLPNLANITKNINIQRGIGTSTNGNASFGASVAIQTQENNEKFNLNFDSSLGSFNTFKNSIQTSTGKINKYFYIDAGLSFIHSDGYIERAFSDLMSFNYKISYKNKSNEVSFFNFGGKEKTYQAWLGIDSKTLKENRKFNYSGAIYDSEGKITDFYKNQTDNYNQNHYHLTWKKNNDKFKLKNTLYLIRGKGFYEEYKQDQNLLLYYIDNKNEYDLIRQKWLDNYFYGFQSQISVNKKIGTFYLGTNINQYLGNHFGKIKEIKNLNINNLNNYYENNSRKNDFSTYIKFTKQINKLDLFIDFQFRNINYQTEIEKPDLSDKKQVLIKDNFNFFNPKAGISYKINNGKLYFSFGKTHREPTRTDYLESDKKPLQEKLINFELGIKQKLSKLSFETNLYYMNYKNQLVLTGKLDEVGNSIRENIDKSYRLGIENSFNYSLSSDFNLFGNLTLSSNKLINENKKHNLSYSPNLIFNFGFDFNLLNKVNISFTNQYIDKQYITNISDRKYLLNDYFTSDLSFSSKKIIKNLLFYASIKNIFNKEYSSNAYFYDKIYFYPQAKSMFLFGMNYDIK